MPCAHFQPISCVKLIELGGAVAQLGARLDGIEEVVGSNPIGSTNFRLTTFSPRIRSWAFIRDATIRTLYKSYA